MRRSNIFAKKIKNIFLLGMILIIIIGIYINIRNSRADDLIKFTAHIIDIEDELEPCEVELSAKLNKDGSYNIEFPETVNSNNVKIYYLGNNRNLEVNENGTININLTEEETEQKLLTVNVKYDKIEALNYETNEKTTLYKKTLEYEEGFFKLEGYMPEKSEMKAIGRNLTIQEAEQVSKLGNFIQTHKFEISIKEKLEENEEIEDQTNALINIENSTKEVEKQYNPEEYGEILTIKTNKNNTELINTQWQNFKLVNKIITGNSNTQIIVTQIEEKEIIENQEKINKSENIEINSRNIQYVESENEILLEDNLVKGRTSYPVMKERYYWYSGISTNKESITEIEFMDSGIPAGTILEQINCDEEGTGSIKAYIVGTKLYIVGNGTGKISANRYCNLMFADFKYVTSIKNIQLLDTENVINMYGMFNNCNNLINLNISSFNTENVTDMNSMFRYCENLINLDISSFNTENVTDMNDMFRSCENLINLDISSFNTENTAYMNRMFNNCYRLSEVTFGNNFKLKQSSGALPTPDAGYINWADGYWYNKNTGERFLPAQIPNNVSATYIAYPTIKLQLEIDNTSWSKSKIAKITITVREGASLNNPEYKYALSTNNIEAPTSWLGTYTNGTEFTIDKTTITSLISGNITGTGEIYLWVKPIRDENGFTFYNNVSNKLYFDNTAPAVEFGTNGNTTWAKSQSTTVNVTDSPGVGSVTEIMYLWREGTSSSNAGTPPNLTDGSSWTYFSNGGTITKNRVSGNKWYLWIYTKDSLGNEAIVHSNSFYLDNNPNNYTITLTQNPEELNNGFMKEITVNISISNDGYSSISNSTAVRQYYLSTSSSGQYGGEWKTFTNNTNFIIGGEGTYYLYINVVDEAGNIGTCTEGTSSGNYRRLGPYKLDNTGPTINSVSKNPNSWTNGEVTIKINATDYGAGIASSGAYSFDNGATWQDSNQKSGYDTNKTITVKVKDMLGNISASQVVIDNIDKTAPIFTISLLSGHSSWTKSKQILITVSDSGGSGLKSSNSYKYYLSTSSSELNDGSWKNYSPGVYNEIGSGLNGTYYLWVNSVGDNAENYSNNGNATYSNIVLKLDNIAVPSSNIIFSPNNNASYDNASYAKSQEVSVTATDGNTDSGNQITLKSVWTTDNYTQPADEDFKNQLTGSYGTITKTITNSSDSGVYYLWVLVTDKAGNSTKKCSGAFYLDNEPPKVRYIPRGS